ncbi:MAG: hypothetical protein NTW94_02930 [Legionellales bacterium]|nr:hypothetical protein [Legionellales bacterium]
MSEKLQHTAWRLHQLMVHRYDDGLQHKHDKHHNLYRHHWRSHPALLTLEIDQEKRINESTGQIHQMNLRKIRKRLAKGRYH